MARARPENLVAGKWEAAEAGMKGSFARAEMPTSRDRHSRGVLIVSRLGGGGWGSPLSNQMHVGFTWLAQRQEGKGTAAPFILQEHFLQVQVLFEVQRSSETMHFATSHHQAERVCTGFPSQYSKLVWQEAPLILLSCECGELVVAGMFFLRA